MTLTIDSNLNPVNSITNFFERTANEGLSTLKSSPSVTAIGIAVLPVLGVLSYIAYSTSQNTLPERKVSVIPAAIKREEIVVQINELDALTIPIIVKRKEMDVTILGLLDENICDPVRANKLIATIDVTLKNDPKKRPYNIKAIFGHPDIMIYVSLMRRNKQERTFS